MNHWYLVWLDIWSFARWLMPMIFFSMGWTAYELRKEIESYAFIELILLVFFYFGYVAAVNGWWI